MTAFCANTQIALMYVHLIPRRTGDVADPIGGVRNTIPGQGNYRTGSINTLMRNAINISLQHQTSTRICYSMAY